MKFLFDAQLPRRLAKRFQQLGYDAIHTLDLPSGNQTSDEIISQVAISESRIVVTKDSDFVDSFWLSRTPPRLLLLSTGNISNQELEGLFFDNLEQLVVSFATHDYVELSRNYLILHQ